MILAILHRWSNAGLRTSMRRIPSLVGEQDLVTANARIMAANNAGQILGPAVAGALVAFVPVPDLLFTDAGSFLISSGCLALIRCSFNPATPARRPAGSALHALLADVREGLAYVWSNPVLRSISIMMALINLVATTADSRLVLFARRALHATSSETGFLYAAGAAGVVAVSLVAGPVRQRASFAVSALGALILAGLTMTAMALAGSYRPHWSCGRHHRALACHSTSAPSHCARRSSRPGSTAGW
jgi:Na+/melibiose symporter-like transporter